MLCADGRNRRKWDKIRFTFRVNIMTSSYSIACLWLRKWVVRLTPQGKLGGSGCNIYQVYKILHNPVSCHRYSIWILIKLCYYSALQILLLHTNSATERLVIDQSNSQWLFTFARCMYTFFLAACKGGVWNIMVTWFPCSKDARGDLLHLFLFSCF